jgi:ABC-type multidrug transport system ATPase subunit
MNPLFELTDAGSVVSGSVLLYPTTLKLTEGETTVFLGPSGSGKSTLLKLVAGLISPSQGKVFYRGKDLAAMSSREVSAFRLSTAFVFQNAAMWQNLTLRQNLALPLNWNFPKMESAEVERRIQFALDQVGYHEALTTRPGEQSIGEQMALGFARALALDPAIYFLDSPLSELDGATAHRIISAILNLKKKNRTLLLVTSALDFALKVADNLCLCNLGRVEFLGTTSQAVAQWPDFLDEINESHLGLLAARDMVIQGGRA